MQVCIHCGRQLSPGMTVCPDCGQNIPLIPETQASYQTSVTGLSTQKTSHTYSAKKSGYSGIYAATQPTSKRTFKRTISVATTVPTLKRHKMFSHIIITVILIVTLFLIITTAGMFYYSEISHPAQLRAQSTTIAQKMQRTNIHHTITRISATKAAVEQNKATAKTVAHGTAPAQHRIIQAQATSISLQNLYTQSTSGHPTLDTSLFYNSSAKWDIYPTKDGGGCAFTENSLHSRAFQSNYYSPCIAHATAFHNFALEIQMTIIEGDEGGIIFRANSHDQDFYSFRMRNDGTYGLILTQNDGHTTPLIYDQSNLIKKGTGRTNTITIIAQGSIFYLYINKHYVGSASDNTYSTGAIGIMAVDRKNQTDVAFNNLRVWKL
jgi:hypothetical protein